MEGIKKEINFDSALLYYSTPNESNEITKISGLNVVQETYNSSNRKHICIICGKRFFTKNSLKTHMEHHPSDQPANANLEKEENADWKNRFVINKGISCVKTDCNFIALDAVEYSKHIVSCEGIRVTKENSSTYCESCDCYYSSENYLKAHRILQHPENGPSISLEDGDQKNTKISDPVSLYVLEKSCEGERSTKIGFSPSMYPDSVVTKKRSKCFDVETSPISISEETTTSMRNGTDLNSLEPSVSEAVEILKSAIKEDNQSVNVKSAEIFSENEIESHSTEKAVENLASSDDISNEICNSGEDREPPAVENSSAEIHPQTTSVSPNPVDVSNKDLECHLPETEEAAEPQPSLIVEQNNDQIEENLSVRVQSKVDESDANIFLDALQTMNNTIESENRAISSCGTELKSCDGYDTESLTEKADTNVQECENQVCSQTGSSEKKVEPSEKHISDNVERSSPLPAITSEKQISSEAVTSLDNLLPITEDGCAEKEVIESNVADEISDQSGSVDQSISKLPSSTASSNENSKKAVKIHSLKKKSKSVEKVTKSKDELSDSPDSKKQEKHVVPANSDVIPKNKNSKSCQKLGKNSKARKSSETRNSGSRSPLSSESIEAKLKYYKSDSFNSSDLNIKQRSVRQRKKLILPDFEYGLENKAEFSDSSTNENSSFYMSDGEQGKKKGRPRKKRRDDFRSKTSEVEKKNPPAVTPKNKSTLPPTSRKSFKKRDENEETSEEFNLTTTNNRSKCKPRFNDSYAADVSVNDSKLDDMTPEDADDDDDDDSNDDTSSWLKKGDFSQQSSLWSESPQKKKLGRPPKKRKQVEVVKILPQTFPDKINKESLSVKSLPQISGICNENKQQVIIKKQKKNRSALKQKSISQQSNTMETAVIAKEIKVVESGETSSPDVSPKKRGRPCKAKKDSIVDSNPVQSCKATVEAGEPVAKKIALAPAASSKTRDEVKIVAPSKTNASDTRKIESVAKPEAALTPKSNTKDAKIENTTKPEAAVEVANSKSNASDTPKIEIAAKTEAASGEVVLMKKRGRPRKSTAGSGGDNESSKSFNVGLESDECSDASVIENNSGNMSALLEASNFMDHSASSNTELDSPKTDRSDLSSVGNRKKRGRPLKKRTLMLKKKEMADPLYKVPRLSGPVIENKSSALEMDVDSDVKQEVSPDNSSQELSQPKTTLWKKKIPTQPPEKQKVDETIKIDEAMYYADLRNKSKYSRVFKKFDCTIDDDTGDKLVVCGRCQKKMTKRHYVKYHRVSHYYLSWLDDEPEINLKDDAEISRILQSYVNPDALRKKAIRLSCEKCDKVMKSVVGYVSHVRFCQKHDEEELLEKCALCPRALKPSSIRHHYIKYHGVTKFATTTDSKLVPVACVDTKKENMTRTHEECIQLTVKNVQMGFERTPVEKVDILNDEHFWKSLKTSHDLYMCMGLSCRHMTLGKDDLKSHILSCKASFCEFACSFCPYITKYESEMIYHSKRKCKETSDTEDNVEEKPSEEQWSEENPDEENADDEKPSIEENPISVSDRRVSTRVRKRKFAFDYDDFIDVDRNRKSKDEEFKPAEEELNLSEEEEEKVKPKPKKRADILLNKTTEETGLRNAFLYHHTTRVFDPLGWTVESRLETFATGPALTNLRVDINEWETFPISDFLKYSPIQHKSPKVSFDGSPFVQLKVFDSDLIKGVPVCYSGGPVWSMAWAPLPAHVTEQYLAVAGLQHMNHVVNLNTSVEFASIVQIWKYGSLDNISNDIHAPTLAWAIAHNYGAVWGLEWCPSGGFDNSSTPCRLGILALATSAGCCVVYSMPRLDCGGETRSIVANPEPDLILKLRCEDVQCTRIVWKRNSVPDTIYGGFSNGTIALWNVTSTSSILKKGKTLFPYRTFEAHHASITALDVHWLDNCRFMISSSSDRTVKYWDLEDLSGPMYEHELTNVAVSAEWMHHWVVTAFGLDFANGVEPASFICHPRELTERRKPILNLKDSFWVPSVAYSDWNDAVAASSNGGCVVVYAAKHLSALTFKSPDFEKIVTQTVMVPLSEEEKILSESVEANTGLPPTNDSYDCTSLVQNYGIRFCDRLKEKPSSDSLNFGLDKGNIKSVNKVCWNQNYNSFNWLALGYDSGFVRVIRVERFDKSHLTKFYKLNENSTITLV